MLRERSAGDETMKLSYDRDRNIAYLRLRPKTVGVETIRVGDELNVDMAPDGSVYGIELLNANEQLRAADGGQLVLVDQADGREIALPLAESAPPAPMICTVRLRQLKKRSG
jgi:uncharacterized protein YuzE